MTAIAFYAPMKSPRHPVPSGDREMARGLLAALAGLGQGEATLVSEFRSYEGQGDPAAQDRLRVEAEAEAARLIQRGRAEGWRLWATYHNYYKAPDLLGPVVSEALGIPYVLFEASRADKRLAGPWAGFERAAGRACDRAQVIYCLTARDREALAAAQPPGQALVLLPPFLNREALPPAARPVPGRLITVAMMRAGDKLASYRQLAAALALVPGDWSLDVIGSGAAEAEVRALLAPFGARVRFLGALPPEGVAAALSEAAIYVWPGVNEAFGMAYLEAMAAGVPVIAEDRPGLREIVPEAGLVPAGDAAAFAGRIAAWLGHEPDRAARAEAARTAVAARHLLPAARAAIRAPLPAMQGEAGA